MKRGFTLIEMLIAISIFTVIAIAFIGILSVVMQAQVQSSSAAAVNQESQFLLQKLQYYIQTAGIIDIPTSTPTSTLKFDVASSSLDPSYITLATGTVYLKQSNGGTLQPLTSNRVLVSNLLFTRQANPPGHDVVSISYTMSYYPTSSIAQAFSQLFQTSIAQVSAATFDINVLPSVTGEPLGNSTYQWGSINGIIQFSGNNVGIGTASAPPTQLTVNGGVQLLSTPQTTCNATYRGTLLFYSLGGTNSDHLYLCANTAGTTTVSWQTLY